MQTKRRLQKITRRLAFTVIIATIITLPCGYFITAYNYESLMLQLEADKSADHISKLIFKYPHTWQYQEHRLENILSTEVVNMFPANYTIFTNNHEVLVHLGRELSIPHHSTQAFLSDGIKKVGYIETQTSLRPLLLETMLALLLAILLSIPIYIALHLLPFSALERVLHSLESSKQQLAEEITQKQLALTKYEQMSEELRYQASHDALTGLGNRSYFQDALSRHILQAKSEQSILAVLIIDLNRFKEINDALGHGIGDQVLIAASHRIQQALAENTILARLGGDEYAILISNTSTADSLEQVYTIIRALRPHIDIDSYHLSISASIGIAFYPQHGTSQEKLMRHADIAMYHAKQNAKDFCQYEKSYHAHSPNRLSLTADLRHAIDNGWLSLCYQPKICLNDGEIIGVEALARWQHPQHGYISPDVFIPLAEQAGMINKLTDWLVKSAIKQLALWQNENKHISMAINISARNLQNDDLSELIKGQLIDYRIPPDKLTLEITESSIMLDPDKSRELINSLSQWGIHISIDDFGTGYSSLAYLKKLTVDELKIDRSFVRNMLNDEDDQIIVRSTIELAHNLHLNVVAEGVEDFSTYHILQEYGVDYVQGYYLCEPLAACEFAHWMQQV